MDDSDLREIKKLMKEIDCPKNFICMKDGYKNLCKAEDLGLDEFLECMQEDSSSCPYSFRFGSNFFCKCGVRFYLARKLEK